MWPFGPSNSSVKNSCCGINNFNVGLLQVCAALENCIGSNGYHQEDVLEGSQPEKGHTIAFLFFQVQLLFNKLLVICTKTTLVDPK